MTEDELAAIEARADYGCAGHGWTAADETLYCPCVEHTAVDVRVLLGEVRAARHAAREFAKLMGEYGDEVIRLRAQNEVLLRAARDQGGAVGRSSSLAELLEALR